jgi:CheY-like chemotaxis protein
MNTGFDAAPTPVLARLDMLGVPDRRPRILVAEDDLEMRRLLVMRLRRAGFETIECADGYQLLDHLGYPALAGEPDDFDLIVSDIRMPGVSGLEVLQGIHETEWSVPVILITAFGNQETHEQAEELGAAAMFDKPFEVDDLVRRIREVLVLDDSKGDNWSLPEGLGDRPAMPLRVIFRNMKSVDFIQARVEESAKVLRSIGEPVLYCRTVITGPHNPMAGRFHVQIMATLRDRVIVVRSNLKSITDDVELYDAIPVAFEVMRAKIEKYIDLERDRWRS